MGTPDPKMTIQGIQEVLEANLQIVQAIKPRGAFGEAIRTGTAMAHRYATAITHVWHIKGGGLRASHRIEYRGTEGQVYIDPQSVNPRGQRPSVYGPHEHARGGTHAFYERTTKEHGDTIGREARAIIRGALP